MWKIESNIQWLNVEHWNFSSSVISSRIFCLYFYFWYKQHKVEQFLYNKSSRIHNLFFASNCYTTWFLIFFLQNIHCSRLNKTPRTKFLIDTYNAWQSCIIYDNFIMCPLIVYQCFNFNSILLLNLLEVHWLIHGQIVFW